MLAAALEHYELILSVYYVLYGVREWQSDSDDLSKTRMSARMCLDNMHRPSPPPPSMSVIEKRDVRLRQLPRTQKCRCKMRINPPRLCASVLCDGVSEKSHSSTKTTATASRNQTLGLGKNQRTHTQAPKHGFLCVNVGVICLCRHGTVGFVLPYEERTRVARFRLGCVFSEYQRLHSQNSHYISSFFFYSHILEYTRTRCGKTIVCAIHSSFFFPFFS